MGHCHKVAARIAVRPGLHGGLYPADQVQKTFSAGRPLISGGVPEAVPLGMALKAQLFAGQAVPGAERLLTKARFGQ